MADTELQKVCDQYMAAYYRLLAEDEGTWADWARRLADALECVLNNPKGGYEQADAYIRAQGLGAKVLADYRRTQEPIEHSEVVWPSARSDGAEEAAELREVADLSSRYERGSDD